MFFFQSVPRDTVVMIVSLSATLHIMEQAVSRRVIVQWTCVMLCLGVKCPDQQVNQNIGAYFEETDLLKVRRSSYIDRNNETNDVIV